MSGNADTRRRNGQKTKDGKGVWPETPYLTASSIRHGTGLPVLLAPRNHVLDIRGGGIVSQVESAKDVHFSRLP
jgi:hypothetical protein